MSESLETRKEITAEKFNAVISKWLARIMTTMETKGDEYTGESDRLDNFKQAAALLRCTPEQALLGFVAKHIVSVYDTVDRDLERDDDYWNEKLGDIINYMILLDALRGTKI